MTQEQGTGKPHKAATPEELRAQVEQTRAELGRTVEALAAKADVRALAHQKADAVKARLHPIRRRRAQEGAHRRHGGRLRRLVGKERRHHGGGAHRGRPHPLHARRGREAPTAPRTTPLPEGPGPVPVEHHRPAHSDRSGPHAGMVAAGAAAAAAAVIVVAGRGRHRD
ncbi:DUF3618 domain-containing protein [Streptomyces sp. NPDC058045]|uniref:DUF3618 domain-containing protein n=1 Tax=Streptomyces sp. NPDC058045 TaxID=3346311 RepID=UPI0036EAFA04